MHDACIVFMYIGSNRLLPRNNIETTIHATNDTLAMIERNNVRRGDRESERGGESKSLIFYLHEHERGRAHNVHAHASRIPRACDVVIGIYMCIKHISLFYLHHSAVRAVVLVIT